MTHRDPDLTHPLNTGSGCRVPASSGWCVSTDDCVDACQLAPEGQSTSAQLRETQRALAASQQDLSGALAERDQANELTDKIAAELRLVTRERDSLARRCAVRFEERQEAVAERGRAWHAHDLTLAELTTAIQERDLLRAQLDQAVVYFDRRHTELREAFQQLKAVYHKGRDHIVDVEQELFDARAELAAANAEIERLRTADKESAQ